MSLVTWDPLGPVTSQLFFVPASRLHRSCCDIQRCMFDVWAGSDPKGAVPFNPGVIERFDQIIEPVQIHNIVMDFL